MTRQRPGERFIALKSGTLSLVAFRVGAKQEGIPQVTLILIILLLLLLFGGGAFYLTSNLLLVIVIVLIVLALSGYGGRGRWR